MDKKQAIICTAANLIHTMGYNNVGIKTILDELNIPKGSFYYYFKSKEDLGLAIIDMYIDDVLQVTESHEKTIDGLRNFFNSFFIRMVHNKLQGGCPIGNLILELSDENESFRTRLLKWYQVAEDFIIEVLEKSNISNPNEKSKALMAAFEGIILLAKLDKQEYYFTIFINYMFKSIINYN